MLKRSLKRKVFIDALPLSVPNLSGIGHLVWNTVNELTEDEDFLLDHEIVLITSRKGLPYLKKHGFKNVSLKHWPIKPKIINALNYFDVLPPVDLFMGQGVYVFDNYTTWPLARSKSLTYIHDVSYEVFPQFARLSVYRMLHKNVPKWIKRTELVVTISEHTKKDIHKYYDTPLNKIKVIYCGVDHDHFYPRTKDEIKEVRKKYDLNKPYIIFLSNLEPRKNLERLVKSFELLTRANRDEISLLLIGSEGWQDEDIQKAINEAKNKGCDIRKPDFYVPDNDLPALLCGAELLAHPAVYEGFGMSVLEAMACGTPVLVSKQSSLPEVVGDAGLYVEYENIDDITNKIRDLLTDTALRNKLVEKGLERSRLFSWSNNEAALKHLIDKLEANS